VVEVFGGIRAGSPGQEISIQSRIGHSGNFHTLHGGKIQLGTHGYFDRVFQVSRASERTYRFHYSGGYSRGAGVHH
jgi:hypothetical protein